MLTGSVRVSGPIRQCWLVRLTSISFLTGVLAWMQECKCGMISILGNLLQSVAFTAGLQPGGQVVQGGQHASMAAFSPKCLYSFAEDTTC